MSPCKRTPNDSSNPGFIIYKIKGDKGMVIEKVTQSIKDFFAVKEPIPPGLYAYQTPPEAKEQYRLHLRIEPDGIGILVINASTVLHLNQTAVEYAYHIIKQTPDDRVVNRISHRYQVGKDQVREDFGAFQNKIQTLIQTPDLDPVTYLDIERQEPYSGEISAPYRLDCALTYQVNEDDQRELTPLDRVDRELSTDEWIAVMHKAYNAGIPHLLFTGGEPTIREDLPELLMKAEELGLVTGLLTDGLKLGDDDYRATLLLNGLDHLMVLLDPEKPEMWNTLEKVLAEDCFTTVHLTLTQGKELQPIIKQLAEMGTNALSLSTTDEALNDNLQSLRDYAAIQQLDLVWDMPVPYSKNNPVNLEMKMSKTSEPPQGAGTAWLYVEPDGDVLPAQGMYDQILGNILNDSWEEIWQKK
jgi:organic radical activating enzyme